VFELVGDGDLRQCSELAIRRLGADTDGIDGMRLKTRDLGNRVRTNLNTQPALEVVVGVRAVIDPVAGDATRWN